VKLARFRKIKVACFLSYVEDRFKYKYKHYHTHTHTYTYIYVQYMFPKVGLLEEIREEEKNDRK
jgi:hypothetical protein